jgi:CheY-like chemotaxis protein
MIQVDPVKEWFAGELRRVLQDLYDPRSLRASPLLRVFDLQADPNPPAALRVLISDAIESLRPVEGVPPHAHVWRIYQILAYRYLEQSAQATVAANLGLSIRQLRRQERVAEATLVDHLWAVHQLDRAAPPVYATAEHEPAPLDPADNGVQERASELTWLQQSLASETVYVGQIIEHAVRTITPLARQLRVQLAYEIADGLPPVVAQSAALRQSLLGLLTVAIRSALGGEVNVTAGWDAGQLSLGVVSTCPEETRGAVTDANGEVAANLEMADELAALSGARLELHAAPMPGAAAPCYGLAARLVLFPAERLPVLAVDDNIDTLKLIERCLANSRYRLVAAPDPQQALALAEQTGPEAILLDVMLPGIDGWELLGRLREHPATADIPLVVCTILPQEQLARALGAADFIRKPITREALLEVLDRLLAPAPDYAPARPEDHSVPAPR